MSSLTMGSLFDGSGAFPLAAKMNGITPIWASEIEPFAIRVTTKRLPEIIHLGDVCQIDGGKIQPVDLITFGSPCQNWSVSGDRTGITGKKSSLFLEAIRVIKEMRCATSGKYPRYAIFENVPGLFSAGKSDSDFRCVLEAFVKIKDEALFVPMPEKKKWLSAGEIMGDGFSIAYRTLQASSWGVPQRRRRIYLVADFGGQSASKVLFEYESLSGYTPQSRIEGKATSTDAGESTYTSSRAKPIGFEPGAMSRLGGHVTEDGICTLRASMGDNRAAVAIPINTHSAHYNAVAIENHPSDSRIKISPDGLVQTLTKRAGSGGNNTALILSNRQSMCEQRKVYGICSDGSNSMLSENPNSGIYEAETSRTIDTSGGNPSGNQGGIAVVETYSLQGSMIGRKDENGPQGSGVNENISFTLNCHDKHSVVYALDRSAYNQGENAQFDISISDDGMAQTIVAKGPGAVANLCTDDQEGLTEPEYAVRRLTTLECVRLMGLPDNWCSDLETDNPNDDEIAFWADVFETHRKIMGTSSKSKTTKQIIKWLKNPNSDSAVYKLMGNGIVLQCAEFVMAGISYYHNLNPNEGS